VHRLGQWVAALAFGIGLAGAPLAAVSGQVVPTTEPPPTTAAPTTAGPTTTRPRPTTTTIPATTTTPEQLPTLPPRPEGQLPAPTETTVAPVSDRDDAKVSPLFPALSIGGFTVALLIVVIQFLWASRKAAAVAPRS
jgi:hypothetical protein